MHGGIRLSQKARDGGRVIVTKQRFTNPKSVDIQNPEILAFLKKEGADRIGTFDENIDRKNHIRGKFHYLIFASYCKIIQIC